MIKAKFGDDPSSLNMNAGFRGVSTYDSLIKLLIIGDSGVGKSCLLMRFCDDTFTQSFISTIGIDFKIKTVSAGGMKLKLQIWDTAGQERFRTITTAYYRGAMGIIIVYDVTEEKSFQNVQEWLRTISQQADPNVKLILVGNKCDSSESRQISYEQGFLLAQEKKMDFVEASAKENICVDEIFMRLASTIAKELQLSSTSSPINELRHRGKMSPKLPPYPSVHIDRVNLNSYSRPLNYTLKKIPHKRCC